MGISRYRYLHYDVFTDRRFGGNQLAVFPDAAGLSGQTMQQIAREIGFAETTFVTAAETARHRRAHADLHARYRDADGRPSGRRQHVRAGARGADCQRRADWVFGLNIGPTTVSSSNGKAHDSISRG